jgi:uncharacterized FAD-dependent dehydrogenase
MPIVVSGIRIGLEDAESVAIEKAIRKLSVDRLNIKDAYVLKQSLDARHKENISFVNTVAIELYKGESEAVNQASDPFVSYKPRFELELKKGIKKPQSNIVIAGFGPAGMFAGLLLAQNGYAPIIVERGAPVDERVEAVEAFWKNGILDEQSNVQFGEGGAGTFSDGKLTTRISDGCCDYVLRALVQHGAPQQILKKAKPHIGTDKLRGVVKSIREDILTHGGKVLFHSKLENLNVCDGQIKSVIVNGQEIETQDLVLAIGHSARDTFEMLMEKDVFIEPKAFSVGARVEQRQEVINQGLYGNLAGHPSLPVGEYQLSHRKGGRCVYTFCMCPGGTVVPSSSEPNAVVTNGMSEFARDQQNANSALVVSVDQNDYGKTAKDAILFQQRLERLAFDLAGGDYSAPGATVNSFLEKQMGIRLNTVKPSYSLGIKEVDFNQIFPRHIMDMMCDGLRLFNKKLVGFATDDAVLTGVETRTSSPIRITRTEDFMSLNIKGLYPCGEGAGYAGGIISAAVDGVKIARKIISKYAPK